MKVEIKTQDEAASFLNYVHSKSDQNRNQPKVSIDIYFPLFWGLTGNLVNYSSLLLNNYLVIFSQYKLNVCF